MTTSEIIDTLPFSAPYLFVDELLYVTEKGASGSYTFNENLEFFKGHFKNNPIVPGAVLTETMAQIGLVCLAIYLTAESDAMESSVSVATSYNVKFFKPVFPNEKVIVTSELIYFRFGKLKANVQMTNENNIKICEGIISGIVLKNSNL
jgi:3-hydroxyacyl-[acyl-carrier-protein] dehydratase